MSYLNLFKKYIRPNTLILHIHGGAYSFQQFVNEFPESGYAKYIDDEEFWARKKTLFKVFAPSYQSYFSGKEVVTIYLKS